MKTQPTGNTFLATYIDLILFARWMFEKYDGVRGFWNPLKRAFFSRHGNRLHLPEHIIAAMPKDIFLDGELW